jgi:4'-phosphopantetheinyl transferase
MLRRMLAEWSGLAAGSLRFGETGNGKPILLDRPDLHFNLSYSDEVILIGVTQQNRLGVDIEWRRAFPEGRALAEHCFDEAEQAALRQGRPGRSESDLFLCGWTRKEACVKASALGLTQDPAKVITGLDTGSRKVMISKFLSTQVETLVQDHYIISWATVI